MRRVLHVTMSNTFSGAENVVCQIIAMYKGDPDTEMVYCGIEGDNIRKALKERDICFAPMLSKSPKEVARVIKEVRPTIIHAHDMKASFFVALTCGTIPYVSHIHNNNFDSRGISAKSIMYYFAAKKVKHIFWVSKSSYTGYAFHKSFYGKSSVLYNVIDAEAVYQKAAKDLNDYDYDIVYVGRLTYQKNPKRLVEVLSLVEQKYHGMKAAIVGTGDLENETRQAIQEHDAERCIEMLGYCSNPYKIMQRAKILIMTSRWEGLPMCALEAMALGVPIVSTPTDGLQETVEDGVTGFLSDDNEILAERCSTILRDEELHRRLQAAILEKSRMLLDVEHYRKEIEKVYQSVDDLR